MAFGGASIVGGKTCWWQNLLVAKLVGGKTCWWQNNFSL
jgi:hypothetical protein